MFVNDWYGEATISRLLKIVDLFCRKSSFWEGSFAKETYNCKEPTNRSHRIHMFKSHTHTRIFKSSLSLLISCFPSLSYTYHVHELTRPYAVFSFSNFQGRGGPEQRNQCGGLPAGTLQHIATHCNTLQHTATHCNTLQHTAAHCSTLQHVATHCNKPAVSEFLCCNVCCSVCCSACCGVLCCFLSTTCAHSQMSANCCVAVCVAMCVALDVAV